MAKLQHVHKYRCGPEDYICDCGAVLSFEVAQDRINAVEKFPLQDAVQVLWCLEHAAGVAVGPEYDALEDYIAELEP